MTARFCILYIFLLISASLIAAETSYDKGVLVVTYHTGRNSERLDRVRFRLINEHREQTMFPRLGTFYENTGRQSRRVTIPNLAAGRYTIEFIVPNRDGLFGEIPQRQITIVEGEIVKIDQTLKPHYARVKATAVVPDDAGSEGPPLRLLNHKGKLVASAHNELMTTNLLPGKYSLYFDPYQDYVTPDPIHFEVKPGASVGPFERHYFPKERPSQKPDFHSHIPNKEPPPLAHQPRAYTVLVETSLSAHCGTTIHDLVLTADSPLRP